MNRSVFLHVERPSEPRDRISALIRPILIIPQLLLVGGPVFGLLGLGFFRSGALGALAWLVALFDWFAILFHDGPLKGLQPFKHVYLEWRARVLAYGSFLRDEYPPFGEDRYPVTLDLPPEPPTRKKLHVLFRPFLLLPHLIVLTVLLMAWFVLAVFTWIWLSITGTMPAWIWRFSRDVMAYSLRVEVYGLLVHDEFPSFSLAQEPEIGPVSVA